jgi:hypothetical protein
MKPSAQVFLVTLIAVSLSGAVNGQVKSDEPVQSVRIKGRVSDASGAPVGDATVVLKLAGSDETTATTKTTETGEYTFLVVPHRSYELHFYSAGFRPEKKSVTADKDTDVGTLTLAVSGIAGSGRVVTEFPVELPASSAEGQRKSQGQKPTPTSKLWAAITVPQPIVEEGGETDRLQIYFGIYNGGDSTVSPNVESSHLFVNGVEPPDWQIVISNGIRNELFASLPPGQTLQFTYLLGPRYFQKPGIYTVRWQGENFKSPELTFRVVPRNGR